MGHWMADLTTEYSTYGLPGGTDIAFVQKIPPATGVSSMQAFSNRIKLILLGPRSLSRCSLLGVRRRMAQAAPIGYFPFHGP